MAGQEGARSCRQLMQFAGEPGGGCTASYIKRNIVLIRATYTAADTPSNCWMVSPEPGRVLRPTTSANLFNIESILRFSSGNQGWVWPMDGALFSWDLLA